MSRTGLDATDLAQSLRMMAGDGDIEWVTEPMQASGLLDIADALDENAKLRELVRDMFNCIRYANEQDWFYFERDKPGCGMSCVVNGEGCGLPALVDRMRELGVEASE